MAARNSSMGAPIDRGIIARAVQGVRYALTGVTPESWYSPGQPLQPQAQQAAIGRQFDFPVGVNTRMTPRGDESVSFAQLRALADNYDLIRLVIETRKDQISRLSFNIGNLDADVPPDARCKEIEQFLRYPDQEHDWDGWIRMLIEDLLVLDAPAIYPRQNLGGKLYALEPVDGATIKRVLDDTGRTPDSPEPAYQQIIKGVVASDYSRDELIYKPRNVRTHKVYGYSPVEQVIMTVNIALRRQLYQLQYYTEGSTPDLIMTVPAEWNPDQVKQFDQYWQARLSGNTAGRSRAMFVPNGVNSINTKDKALHDQFDDWLARIVCYAFSISPSAFVKDTNKATANTAKDIASEEGLQPLMKWIKSMMDMIIAKQFGYTDLCFNWNMEKDHDPMQQALINQIYVTAKVLTPDEVRTELGFDPLTDEQKEAMTPTPPPVVDAPGLQAPAGIGDDGVPVGEKVSKSGMPEIHNHINITTPDILVDVGATTIHAAFDRPKELTA